MGKRPWICLFLIVAANILLFAQLYHNIGVDDVFCILFGSMTILIIVGFIVLHFTGGADIYIYLVVSMLSCIGTVMIYRLDKEQGIRQIIWFFLGIVVMFIVKIASKYFKYWDNAWYVLLAAIFLSLAATQMFGVTVGGATNWIVIGNIRFQPSEAVKFLFVLFLACYHNKHEKLVKNKIINLLLPFAVCYVSVLFLVLQREWGVSMLIILIFFAVEYVYNEKRIFLFINAVFMSIFSYAGYNLMNHIKIRVDTWINPWADISGKGYQIAQSLFAIFSGGLLGTGIGLGRPDIIPAAQTDFIFSAICEELGIFTGAGLLLLYLLFFLRGLKMTFSLKHIFSRCCVVGITSVFAIQSFIIIAGVTKFMPLTGITLPFVSYGGSSMLVSFAITGLLQSIRNIDELISNSEPLNIQKA